MFRMNLVVPSGFRRDDQATRALREFELFLRDTGASTIRHGTSLTFSGGLLTGRWSSSGRGSVTWRDATTTSGPRFVLTGSTWPELVTIMVAASIGGVATGSYRLYLLGSAIPGGFILLLAGLRLMWFRRRLAAIISSLQRDRRSFEP